MAVNTLHSVLEPLPALQRSICSNDHFHSRNLPADCFRRYLFQRIKIRFHHRIRMEVLCTEMNEID